MDVKRLGRTHRYACAMGVLGLSIGLGLVTLWSKGEKANRTLPNTPVKRVENFHQRPRATIDPGPVSAPVDRRKRARLTESYLRLPLTFEESEGQATSPVRFLSRGPGYTLYVTNNAAVLALQNTEGRRQKAESRKLQAAGGQSQMEYEISPPAVLRMRLLNANSTPPMTGLDELPGKSNYFIGDDPAQWHRNVSNYAQVKLAGVYPGIDLVYYGNQRQLEYDFVVAPGADPGAIALSFDAPRRKSEIGNRKFETGNRKLETGNSKSEIRNSLREDRRPDTGNLVLDADGDLIVSVGGGTVDLHKPVAYQPRTPNSELRTADSPRRTLVDARYVLDTSHRVRLQLVGYDPSRPLIIDPVLTYSTYLGGLGSDFGNGIAVDSSGAAYVTGQTASSNFPPGSPAMSSCSTCVSAMEAAPDAFVTKLSADGSSVVYSTYLGGNANDEGNAIAVDSVGNAYVAGTTVSTDFPTTMGAFQTTLGGGGPLPDVFVAKLNPSGSALVYSTYLGGSGEDDGFGIAVDASSNCTSAGSCAVYVTGATSSGNFPVANAHQAKLSGGFDAFVTKLDPTGATEVYSTYLGGTGQDEAFSIAVDASANAYVTGQTTSNDFPTQAPYQAAFGGNTDAFVAKLSFSGSTLSLAYSTYLGGSNLDSASGIAVDSSGSAYVAGVTQSTNFPLQNALQGTFGGGSRDAFVAKLNPAGSALVYSTYLGGSGDDTAQGIAVDSAGRAHVAGFTTSSNFPLSGAVQTTNKGNQDGFVARLNPSGCALAFSTYLGGQASDQANNITVDSSGASYVVGTTGSNDFPTQSPLQPATGGGNDAFVAKIAALPAAAACLSVPNVTFSPQDVTTTSAAQKVMLTNGGDTTLNITSIAANGDFAETNTCGNSLNAGANCTVSVTFAPTSFGARNGTVTVTDNAANSPQVLTLTGTGNDFGLSSSPATATISRGLSATFTLTLVASPSFTSAVTLTCSGAPPDGNCSITPSSITPTGGSSTTATMTVTTLGPSMVAPLGGPGPVSPLAKLFARAWLLIILALLLLALIVQFWFRRYPRLAWLRLALPLVALTLLILLWSGCGAGGGNSTPSSTPPGNYQLTVKGSADSASLAHSINVGLTVQ